MRRILDLDGVLPVVPAMSFPPPPFCVAVLRPSDSFGMRCRGHPDMEVMRRSLDGVELVPGVSLPLLMVDIVFFLFNLGVLSNFLLLNDKTGKVSEMWTVIYGYQEGTAAAAALQQPDTRNRHMGILIFGLQQRTESLSWLNLDLILVCAGIGEDTVTFGTPMYTFKLTSWRWVWGWEFGTLLSCRFAK